MIRRVLCCLLICAPLSLFAQGNQANLPPRLVAADLPTYPAIAEAAHVAGRVEIQITIDRGNIVGTKVLVGQATDLRGHVLRQGVQLLIAPTLTNLKSWRFDSDSSGTFVVTYRYRIEGPETESPTTPRIDISPDLVVSITARPVKPTVNY